MPLFNPPTSSALSLGAHAYWRVLGSGIGNVPITKGFTAYSAMGFQDASGSTISASGGTAIESDHTSTFAAANAFDGTNSTFWESGSTIPAWVGYQFATAQAVARIGLQKASSMDNSNPANFGFFQWSDDGKTWFTAAVGHIATLIIANDTMVWFDLTSRAF